MCFESLKWLDLALDKRINVDILEDIWDFARIKSLSLESSFHARYFGMRTVSGRRRIREIWTFEVAYRASCCVKQSVSINFSTTVEKHGFSVFFSMYVGFRQGLRHSLAPEYTRKTRYYNKVSDDYSGSYGYICFLPHFHTVVCELIGTLYFLAFFW